MTSKKSFPFYPFLLAIFPIFSLIATNAFETQFLVVIRPLVIVIAFCGVLFTAFYFIFRKNEHKAALVTGAAMVLFFSYGHIFNLVSTTGFLENFLGRHRYITVIFIIIWTLILALSVFRDIKPELSKLLNIFGIILLVLPVIQIGWFYVQEAIARQQINNGQTSIDSENFGRNYSPDVYYIILDSYARPDALMEDYGMDLSGFVSEMESMGFYYASESHSNYDETFTSITSALNLNLIGPYISSLGIEPGSAQYQELLKKNEVRSLLESWGYQTIAFSTGYRWSEWNDAHIYYETRSTNPLGAMTPFENLLFKNTIIYPYRGYYQDFIPKTVHPEYGIAGVTHSIHIQTQLNILDTLPEIPQNPNPTFTFAHILIPHPPYVFAADGGILQDPGYFSGDKAGAVDDFYDLDGYANQVEFINQRITTICRAILDNSEIPPIILIQGDHGWKNGNRQMILNMYHFPDQGYSELYPSITPVNSFRIILDKYYGMDFPLVDDQVLNNQ
jgi:hypothetical protein